jgi:hypothetical protein
MDFKRGVDFVSYLESGARNHKMKQRLGELQELLISLKRDNNRLRGVGVD